MGALGGPGSALLQYPRGWPGRIPRHTPRVILPFPRQDPTVQRGRPCRGQQGLLRAATFGELTAVPTCEAAAGPSGSSNLKSLLCLVHSKHPNRCGHYYYELCL